MCTFYARGCKRTIDVSVRHEYASDAPHRSLGADEQGVVQAHFSYPRSRGLGWVRQLDRMEDWSETSSYRRDSKAMMLEEGKLGENWRAQIAQYWQGWARHTGWRRPFEDDDILDNGQGLGWRVTDEFDEATLDCHRPGWRDGGK